MDKRWSHMTQSLPCTQTLKQYICGQGQVEQMMVIKAGLPYSWEIWNQQKTWLTSDGKWTATAVSEKRRDSSIFAEYQTKLIFLHLKRWTRQKWKCGNVFIWLYPLLGWFGPRLCGLLIWLPILVPLPVTGASICILFETLIKSLSLNFNGPQRLTEYFTFDFIGTQSGTEERIIYPDKID